MGFTGASVGRECAIALEHRPRLPPGDLHQVGLSAILDQPLVGEGVPELVRVQARETRLGAAAP
jgi:hypothetical protein